MIRFDKYPYKEKISELKQWYENTITTKLLAAPDGDILSICIDSILEPFHNVILRDGYHIYAYVVVQDHNPNSVTIAAIADGENADATVETKASDNFETSNIILPNAAIDPNFVIMHSGISLGYLEAVLACTAIHQIAAHTRFDYFEVLFGEPAIPKEESMLWEYYIRPDKWTPCYSEKKHTVNMLLYKFRPKNDGWTLDADGWIVFAKYEFILLDDRFLDTIETTKEMFNISRHYLLNDEQNCKLPTLHFGDTPGIPCLIEPSYTEIAYIPENNVVW